jgi:hypothetical protein
LAVGQGRLVGCVPSPTAVYCEVLAVKGLRPAFLGGPGFGAAVRVF